MRTAPMPRIVSAALVALVAGAFTACSSAPATTCGESFVVDQATWLADDYGYPYWDAPDPSDPSYYPYTDESGDPVDPSSGDPSSYDPGASDPGTSDPGTSDPGATDPGASDPGSSDPGSSGDDTSAASVRPGQPPATVKLRPDTTPAPTDANGCYRCGLACTFATSTTTQPGTTMMASGASDTSVPDACLRARRAIDAWAAHNGSRVDTCAPAQ